MRRPVEMPHHRPPPRSARRAVLALVVFATAWCGVAGLVEPGSEPTESTRWSCTRDGSVIEVRATTSSSTRTCTARELHDGGLWQGVL